MFYEIITAEMANKVEEWLDKPEGPAKESARNEYRILYDLCQYSSNKSLKYSSTYTAMRDALQSIIKQKGKEWGDRMAANDKTINAAWIAKRMQAMTIVHNALIQMERYQETITVKTSQV